MKTWKRGRTVYCEKRIWARSTLSDIYRTIFSGSVSMWPLIKKCFAADQQLCKKSITAQTIGCQHSTSGESCLWDNSAAQSSELQDYSERAMCAAAHYISDQNGLQSVMNKQREKLTAELISAGFGTSRSDWCSGYESVSQLATAWRSLDVPKIGSGAPKLSRAAGTSINCWKQNKTLAPF